MRATVLGRAALVGAAVVLALGCADQSPVGVAPRAAMPPGRRVESAGGGPPVRPLR